MTAQEEKSEEYPERTHCRLEPADMTGDSRSEGVSRLPYEKPVVRDIDLSFLSLEL